MKISTGTRLTLVALVAVVALLPVAGWLITLAFERSAMAAFDRRLDAYADALAGRLRVARDGSLEFPSTLRDPRFEQVFSGWYWQVRQGRQVEATSRSLWDSSLDYAAPERVQRNLDVAGPRGEPLRASVMELQLAGRVAPVELLVAAPLAEIRHEVQAFSRPLSLALGALGLMLVLVLALQIRWGLAPLRRMEHSLQRVRAGTAARVQPDLPPDLRQVADVMNAVLARQEDLLERARSTAGNLAHALKTPLAAMRLQIERGPADTGKLRGALTQVQGIVEHHLTRAAAAGRAGGISHRTRLEAAVTPVVDAVRGMHRDRGIVLEARLAGDEELAMDAQDLQELVGNLLDNAVKWARSRVALNVAPDGDHVLLHVEDDGPGIPAEERARAMSRGMQLDEHSHGSGLGLAIVRDIASLYDIQFELGESTYGGLRATLRLPRAPRRDR